MEVSPAKMEAQFDSLDNTEGQADGSTDVGMEFALPVGEDADGQQGNPEQPVVELAPGEGVCCVCAGTFEDNFIGSTGLF